MSEEPTFTTSEGRIVRLKHVARRHVDRIRAKHKMPEPPTYSFEAAGGEVVVKLHDETTLTTLEDHKQWNEYQKARIETLAAQQRELAVFLIYNCVAEDPPPPEQWAVDFELWGLDAPDQTDLIQYKVEWFESEVCINPGDYAKAMTMLYQMGGLIGADQVAEFESFFRTTMERLGLT